MKNPEQVLSLFVLLQRVREAVERDVPDPVWVCAEISELKRNPSGHCYLTLIEKSPSTDQVRSRVNAIIWSNTFRLIDPMFRRATGSPLVGGMSILFQARVQFSEQYGLSLIISDIDPSFTLGEQEALRRRTIERLEEEGMMDMNAQLPLPTLPRRFAVITSATAAGWRDFCNHLCGNEYGYSFHLEHFPAVMQGEEAPVSIISALDAVALRASEFDAVLILRGGGSAMDLACFDDYLLASNVAQFPLPVLTGIGHDHDHHVVDMVAHTDVKTPTALADFILDIFAQEEYRIVSLAARLRSAIIASAARQEAVLDTFISRMRAALSVNVAQSLQRLTLLEARVLSCDPARALERGFSFIFCDGKKISLAQELKKGDKITIILRDGTIKATVDD